MSTALKALVVDDSRVIRRIVGDCLRAMQVEVFEADNGRTALEALRKIDGIGFVLLDWNMPVMSGIDCLHELRQDERFKDVRVCMVTSEAEMSAVVKALNEGANEYLMKPFEPEALHEKLQMLMGAFEQ